MPQRHRIATLFLLGTLVMTGGASAEQSSSPVPAAAPTQGNDHGSAAAVEEGGPKVLPPPSAKTTAPEAKTEDDPPKKAEIAPAPPAPTAKTENAPAKKADATPPRPTPKAETKTAPAKKAGTKPAQCPEEIKVQIDDKELIAKISTMKTDSGASTNDKGSCQFIIGFPKNQTNLISISIDGIPKWHAINGNEVHATEINGSTRKIEDGTHLIGNGMATKIEDGIYLIKGKQILKIENGAYIIEEGSETPITDGMYTVQNGAIAPLPQQETSQSIWLAIIIGGGVIIALQTGLFALYASLVKRRPPQEKDPRMPASDRERTAPPPPSRPTSSPPAGVPSVPRPTDRTAERTTDNGTTTDPDAPRRQNHGRTPVTEPPARPETPGFTASPIHEERTAFAPTAQDLAMPGQEADWRTAWRKLLDGGYQAALNTPANREAFLIEHNAIGLTPVAASPPERSPLPALDSSLWGFAIPNGLIVVPGHKGWRELAKWATPQKNTFFGKIFTIEEGGTQVTRPARLTPDLAVIEKGTISR